MWNNTAVYPIKIEQKPMQEAHCDFYEAYSPDEAGQGGRASWTWINNFKEVDM